MSSTLKSFPPESARERPIPSATSTPSGSADGGVLQPDEADETGRLVGLGPEVEHSRYPNLSVERHGLQRSVAGHVDDVVRPECDLVAKWAGLHRLVGQNKEGRIRLQRGRHEANDFDVFACQIRCEVRQLGALRIDLIEKQTCWTGGKSLPKRCDNCSRSDANQGLPTGYHDSHSFRGT